MWFDVVVCGDQEYQFHIHFFLLLILFSSVEYLPVRDIDRPPSSPLVDAADSPCGKLWLRSMKQGSYDIAMTG